MRYSEEIVKGTFLASIFHHRFNKGCITFLGVSLVLLLKITDCSASPPAKIAENPRVLVLHSYHVGFTWSDHITSGIQNVFRKQAPQAELLFEYMDEKRRNDPEYFDIYHRFLQQKYLNQKIDVIIASDDRAFDFLLGRGKDLFIETPVVFCGVNGYEPRKHRESSREITGVVESIDIRSTLEIALQLHPRTRVVAYVTDTSLPGIAVKMAAEEVFNTFDDPIHFKFMEHKNMDQLKEEVSRLPHNSIVLAFIFNRDQWGRIWSHEYNLERMVSWCQVPIYSVWEFYLGHGIVGGMLTSGVAHGEAAAQMAMKILKGEKASNIPVRIKSPNRFMFDYIQMKRFGININDLPAGSLVIDKPDSIFKTHKNMVLIAFSLIVILVTIVFFLSREVRFRRQSEHAIQKSRKRLIDAQRIAGIGDFEWDVETGNVTWSDALFDLLKYDRNQKIDYNRVNAEIHHPEDLERVTQWLNDSVRSGGDALIPNEYRIIRKDGEALYVRTIGVIHREDGKSTKIFATIQDITERKKAEIALRESERKFRKLIEESPLGIALIGDDGEYKYVNPTFQAMFGYTLDNIPKRGERDNEKLSNPNTFENAFVSMEEKIRQSDIDAKRPFVYTITCEDGSRKVLHIRQVTMDNCEKLVVYEDVTEMAKLERQLQQAQKFEAIGTLAGGIAHDFNNILMGIQGHTSLMAMDAEPTHSNWEHLQTIENYIHSAAELTHQLLGFARGGKYETKPVDINELVHQSAMMFGRTKKEIRIHKSMVEPAPVVEADRRQIEQVLLNLYVNAWQAMPEGGELFIETQTLVLDDAFAMLHQIKPGRYTRISITDTGIGMDESIRHRIFDPFFTTKEKNRGTGLGLASAYGIIKNHAGLITVYSEPGQGTTFNIYLPLSVLKAQKENIVQEELVKGSETVLLIDDEDMILNVGQAMLEKLGYTVIIAQSGKQVIDIIEHHGNEIDVVLLDLIMPGMDGGKIFDHLRNTKADIPVILSSGYSINGMANKIMERGCNGFIQKPFNMIELSSIIRKILNKK